MLDKRQIQVVFLFEFKMGHKVHQRQFTVSAMHLVQNLLTQVECSGSSRSFTKETRALKMRSAVAGHQSWQWSIEMIIEPDPLTTTWEVARKLNINHSTVVQNLKQMGKVKRLDKWPAHQLNTNQKKKKSSFWSVVFAYFMQQWFISPSDYDVKQKVDFIQQPRVTSSVVRHRGSSKALLKAKLEPKNIHGQCLVVCYPSDWIDLAAAAAAPVWSTTAF